MNFKQYKAFSQKIDETASLILLDEGIGRWLAQKADKVFKPVNPEYNYLTGKARNAIMDLAKLALSSGVGIQQLVAKLAKAGIDLGTAPFKALDAAKDVYKSSSPVSKAFGLAKEDIKNNLKGLTLEQKQTYLNEVHQQFQ